jgi:hypothetical protein
MDTKTMPPKSSSVAQEAQTIPQPRRYNNGRVGVVVSGPGEPMKVDYGPQLSAFDRMRARAAAEGEAGRQRQEAAAAAEAARNRATRESWMDAAKRKTGPPQLGGKRTRRRGVRKTQKKVHRKKPRYSRRK